MVTHTLPLAVYGSSPGRGYEVQSAAPAFGAPALQAFHALCRAFQFQASTFATPYPDSFAFWPFDGGTLVARVRDAGSDDSGRPHTLRVEAALVPATFGAGEAGGLLKPQAWPQSVGGDTVTLAPVPADATVTGLIGHDRPPRLLVAGHEYFDRPSVDVAVGPDGTVRPAAEPPPPSSNLSTQAPQTGAKRPWIVLVTVGLIGVALGAGGSDARRASDRERMEDEHRRATAEYERKLADHASDKSQLAAQLKTATDNLRALSEERQVLRETLASGARQLEAVQRPLREQVDALGRQVDAVGMPDGPLGRQLAAITRKMEAVEKRAKDDSDRWILIEEAISKLMKRNP